MKLALALLPTAVLGMPHVARKAQLSSVWTITDPKPDGTSDPITYDVPTGVFTVNYVHGGGGASFIEVFALPSGKPSDVDPADIGNACKTRGGVSKGKFVSTGPVAPGAAGNPAHTGSSVDWLTETYNMDNPENSIYSFTINADIVSAPTTVYEDPDIGSAGDLSGAANSDETVLFCLFFGLTDDFQVPAGPEKGDPSTYGPTVTFLEIAMEVTFTFDGEFALSDFETKALDPLADGETVDFSVDVRRCPGSLSAYNQLTPIPICICPDSDENPTAGPVVSVASIQTLFFGKRKDDLPANPTDLSTMADVLPVLDLDDPIYDDQGLVGLLAINKGDPLIGSVAVTCDPKANKEGIDDRCCKVDVLLGEMFFPAPQSPGALDPVTYPLGQAVETHVVLQGYAYMQIGDALDGTFVVGDADGDENTDGTNTDPNANEVQPPPNRRLVRARINNKLNVRDLQDQEEETTDLSDLKEEPIEGEIDFIAVPVNEEGSSASKVSYFALVGAAVAALLL